MLASGVARGGDVWLSRLVPARSVIANIWRQLSSSAGGVGVDELESSLTCEEEGWRSHCGGGQMLQGVQLSQQENE